MLFRHQDRSPVHWSVVPLISYAVMVEKMNERTEAILNGTAREAVWLLEHPAGFNEGATSKPSDLRGASTLKVEKVKGGSRGGSYSYHGPGVRGVAVMLNLRMRRPDMTGFVRALEDWIIATLGILGVEAFRHPDDPAGVWVDSPVTPGTKDKIAAIGLRMNRYVTSYGFAIYVTPNLNHFDGIVPCGVEGCGVTSLEQVLGRPVPLTEVDANLQAVFVRMFGPITPTELTLEG